MSDELEDALQAVDAGDESPAYLLWGEEYLVRKGAEALVEKLVPNAAAGLNLVTVDGQSPREVAAELATLPLFPGRKVVMVRDPEWLAPKKGRTDALGKAKDAWKQNRRKEAARRVLAIAARAGFGPAQLGDADADAWESELGISLSPLDEALDRAYAWFARHSYVPRAHARTESESP